MSKRNEEMSQQNQIEEQRVEAQIQDDLREIKDVRQVRQITQFIDEEKETSKIYKESTRVVSDPYVNQDLVGFLSRPYPVATIAWKHAAARGACIGRYVFPDLSFKVNALWKKLQQFQYFRAGLCFTIKVNASAYHYGKLLCVWRPLALGKTSNDTVLGGPAAGYDNLYTLSSFPHVIVNANSCESIDFYVDYSLPYDWIDLSVWSDYNINRKMMNMGLLEFWVLNPLYAMGQPTDPDAVIALFAAFTNPEVAGYTSQEYVYTDVGFFNGYKTMVMPNAFSYNQQLIRKEEASKGKEKLTIEKILQGTLPEVQSLKEDITYEEEAIVERILQILREQAQYIDQTELKNQKKKKAFRKFIGDAFSCLPLCQAGEDAGNNTMDVKQGVYKVTQFPMQIASTHVDHAAIPLSLFQDVSCNSQASNSMYSFLSKPCLLHQFEITKTGKWGDTFMSIPVSPMWYPVGSYESVSKRAKFLTRLAMYARLFEMWRGTLRYHFNIVCSRFHSLRIRVYWMPGKEADDFKIFMASNAVNKVVDIEGSTDFYVDVPWLNRLDFLRTKEDDSSNNGFLYLDLLNPIVYPEATMPPVQVNVWISAGPDFEVELLRKKVSYMSVPSWKKSSKEEEKGKGGVPKAQSGDDVDSGPILGEDSKIQMPKIVGERRVTLQDLITKPVPFHRFTQAQNEISYVPNAREARIEGGIFFYSNSSLYDYFAVCYGALSGAVRFHSVSLKSGSIGFLPEVNNGIVYYRGKAGLSSIDDFLDQNGYTSGVIFDNSTLLRTVTLPFYCNSKYIPMTFAGMEGDLPQDLIYPMARIMVFAAADGSMLYASASENFYYHLPMGVPLMID